MSYRLVAARAGARVLRAPAWLRAVRVSPAVGALRADRARTVLEVAAVLALATRGDSTAAPTWPVLIQESGYSRASVARVLAWLRAQGLVVTLENGSTPQFRPDPTRQRQRADRPAPIAVEGNRAAVYLLTAPLPQLPQPASQASAQVRTQIPREVPREAHGRTARASQQDAAPADQSDHRAPASAPEQAGGGVVRLETPPHLSRRERLKNYPAGADARATPTSTVTRSQPRPMTVMALLPSSAAGRTAQMPGGRSQVADTSGNPQLIKAPSPGLREQGPGGDRVDTDSKTQPTSTPDLTSGPPPGQTPVAPGTAAVSRGARRAHRLAVAEALRTRALDLRGISVAAVASVIRDFVECGWDAADLAWAIDHTPDGARRTYTAPCPTTQQPDLAQRQPLGHGPGSPGFQGRGGAAINDLPQPPSVARPAEPGGAAGFGDAADAADLAAQLAELAAERRRRGVLIDGGARPARVVASPAAWLRWRLAPWQGLAGPVAASRAAAAERSAAARAATQRRREEQAAAVAAAVPPPVELAAARAALRARRTW